MSRAEWYATTTIVEQRSAGWVGIYRRPRAMEPRETAPMLTPQGAAHLILPVSGAPCARVGEATRPPRGEVRGYRVAVGRSIVGAVLCWWSATPRGERKPASAAPAWLLAQLQASITGGSIRLPFFDQDGTIPHEYPHPPGFRGLRCIKPIRLRIFAVEVP